MADKIQVAVRVRPVLSHEKPTEIHWACEKEKAVQVDPVTHQLIGIPYQYNHVFPPESSNHALFETAVKPVIESSMEGFNTSVFAYGQTNAGKTHTMMGTPEEPGIVQLAVNHIFHLIQMSPERAFTLQASYIEIYNETISDLLSPPSTSHVLKVRDLGGDNVRIKNLTENSVETVEAVLKLMQQGNEKRQVGATNMNKHSSRSHTIFCIIDKSCLCLQVGKDTSALVSQINLGNIIEIVILFLFCNTFF